MSETSLVKHADDASFDAVVLQSPRLVLVDFWAPWCGPCKAIAPLMDEIAQLYGEKLDVVKVNVDESREVSIKFGIHSIPTLLLIRDGQLLDTSMGALPKAKLAAFIDKQLAS